MGTIERLVSTAALAILCGGCSSGARWTEPTAESAGRLTELNGVNFNGVNFNGVRLNALPFAGLSLGGQALTGVTLAGATLAGFLPGGDQVSGRNLVGAILAGTLSNGMAVTLRIDDVTSGEPADILRYSLSMGVDPGGTFAPFCTSTDGTQAQAIPLAGSWDESSGTASGGAHLDEPSTFTFACEGYALAKCVEMGYAPWLTVTECKAPGDCADRSLASFHQACTRMLRADYCGDGTPTTRDGTKVDLWDHFGIQGDDQPAWNLEAEWSAAGSVCVDRTRWATSPDGSDVEAYIQDHCPERWQAPGCGGDASTFFTPPGFDAPLASRSLLRTRIDHP